MKKDLIALAASLLLAFSASLAHGQAARVRVTAPALHAKPIVGTLVETSQSEIVVSSPESGSMAIPRSEITRLERSEGSHGHAGMGALIGAGTGLAWVVVAVAVDDSGEGSALEASIFGAVFAGAGALVGGGVGALVRTERWTPRSSSALQLTVRPTRGRGIAVAVTRRW